MGDRLEVTHRGSSSIFDARRLRVDRCLQGFPSSFYVHFADTVVGRRDCTFLGYYTSKRVDKLLTAVCGRSKYGYVRTME